MSGLRPIVRKVHAQVEVLHQAAGPTEALRLLGGPVESYGRTAEAVEALQGSSS